MRISHRYRFVFFARPKTGSSSIRQFLNPWSDVFPAKNFKERSGDNPFYPHMRPVEARELFRSFGWNFEGYTRFVFARNPWARVVSLYRHVCEDEPRPPGFDDWVYTIQPDGTGGGGEDWQRWRRYGAWSLERFVGDADGVPLVDHVLRLEDVQRDLKPFLARLGLPGVVERAIPHSNDRSRGESYMAFYTRVARERVAELYHDEIERYGYTFGE